MDLNKKLYPKVSPNIKVIINDAKGIWCEACGKDCEFEHLITIQVDPNIYEHLCTDCTRMLVDGLKKVLMLALLTDKEIVKL